MFDRTPSSKPFPFSLGPLDGLPPEQFETSRLQLSAVTAEDSKLIFDAYASDPIATKYMAFKCTGQLEDTAHYVESVLRFRQGLSDLMRSFMWVIRLKDSSAVIGGAGLDIVNDYCLRGGYILACPYWGRGFASEAWTCLVNWARAQSRIYRVEACHDRDNPNSGKVLRKSGMNFEGILKRAYNHPNVSAEPRDGALYAWSRD